MKFLVEQFNQQEKEKDILLKRLDTFSSENVEWKATKNEWSIIEVLEHIILGEQIVVQRYLERKNVVVRNKTFKDSILYYIVVLVLRLNIPVSIPTKSLDPIKKLSLKQIEREWKNSRKLFKKHITSLTNKDVDVAYFVHPVCGPITTQQALTLSKYHFAVHRKQITTIIDIITYRK